MIHLFNSVFLEQDKYIDFSNTLAIYSKVNGKSNVSHNPDVLASCESAHAGGIITSLINEDKKVIIYADDYHFSQIAATWFKSTVNFDKASFETFMDCYDHKITTLNKTNKTLIQMTKDAFNNPEQEIVDVSKYDYMPSYEFLLASAFYNKDEFKYKDKLKTLLSIMVKRAYQDDILEQKRLLDRMILDTDIQMLLGGKGKDITNYKELPKMSLFNKSYWDNSLKKERTPAHSYLGGSKSKVDITKASDEDLDELVDFMGDIIMLTVPPELYKYGIDPSSLKIDKSASFKYIKSLAKGELSDAEYETVLQEILDEKAAMKYFPNSLYDSIQYVFVIYLKSLKQDKNDYELAKFTLR